MRPSFRCRASTRSTWPARSPLISGVRYTDAAFPVFCGPGVEAQSSGLEVKLAPLEGEDFRLPPAVGVRDGDGRAKILGQPPAHRLVLVGLEEPSPGRRLPQEIGRRNAQQLGVPGRKPEHALQEREFDVDGPIGGRPLEPSHLLLPAGDVLGDERRADAHCSPAAEERVQVGQPTLDFGQAPAATSEHGDSEDMHGRLSMWRAFGK